MPGCGMHSKPKLAEKARYNSLLKIKYTTGRDTVRRGGTVASAAVSGKTIGSGSVAVDSLLCRCCFLIMQRCNIMITSLYVKDITFLPLYDDCLTIS